MYCINLHPPDICHNQFSTASLLGNVFKPLLVKLNLKAGKYATFILQTTATFELKELKPANVIPQTSSGHRLIWCGRYQRSDVVTSVGGSTWRTRDKQFR